VKEESKIACNCCYSLHPKTSLFLEPVAYIGFNSGWGVIKKLVDKSVYFRKTNKMHLYLINLYKLNYSVRVSNKHVHHQEVISVLAANNISHASMCCLAAKTIGFQSNKSSSCWSFSSMYHDARFRECKIITVYYHINLQFTCGVTILTSLSLDTSILFI